MAVTVPAGTYPYEYNITCRRGDTFTEVFTFTSRDFSGYTFRCEVRDLYDKKRILEFTPALAGTNVVTLARTATQMNVRAGRYKYDFAAISPAGSDTDYLSGYFAIADDISANVDNPLEDNPTAPTVVTDVIEVEAAEAINSYMPVAIIGGLAYKLDSSNIDHLYAYAGFSQNGVSAGDTVLIQQIGLLTKSGWGLTANAPYYAGADGSIDTSDSPSGYVFRKIVGISVSTETMMITQSILPYGALIDV